MKITVVSLIIALLVTTIGCSTVNDIEVEFPIDSDAEAISYAKQDPDVDAFIDRLAEEGWGARYGVEHHSDSSWLVIISAKSRDVSDFQIVIHFLPDGTIISKGPGGP